jgi:surfeit locus 1 family protein
LSNSISAIVTQRAIPALAALVVVVVTASLGSWQLRRADEKSGILKAREDAARSIPMQLQAANLNGLVPAQMAQKAVQLNGVFETERSVFIDNRSLNGKAGFHVVTPLKIDGTEQRVAVLRGWVARDIRDVTQVPSVQATSGVQITGVVEINLGRQFDLKTLSNIDPAQMQVPPPTQKIWTQFDPKPYAQWSGLSIAPIIVRQTSALEDGLIRQWTVKADDVSKHQGYAAQWFAMSATTLLLWLYFGLVKPYKRSNKKSSLSANEQ